MPACAMAEARIKALLLLTWEAMKHKKLGGASRNRPGVGFTGGGGPAFCLVKSSEIVPDRAIHLHSWCKTKVQQGS
jgi:hypothetical protein